MSWKESFSDKIVSFEQAVDSIKDGEALFLGSASTNASEFASALIEKYESFDHLTVVTALALKPVKLDPKIKNHITFWSYFMGPFERVGLQKRLSWMSPVCFSNLDLFFPLANSDVLVLDATLPDELGNVNLGPINGAITADLLRNNPRIIVQINEKTPVCYGQNAIFNLKDADMIFELSSPPGILPSVPKEAITREDNMMAEHIIDMIPDGACIQLGLGTTADAVGYMLETKKDLGVHTELLTGSMIHLAKKGIINGSKKNFHPGKMAASLIIGNEEMYDFADRNEMIFTMPLSVLANPATIARNDNFVSINNALAVDLTGQVASEGVGFNQYSSTGGQLDFVRGALRSKGGKSIILLPSVVRQKDGTLISKISLTFAPGTPITTPRTDVQYIGTEYGCVNLWGLPLNKRAELLISIAHPDFRDELTAQAKEAGVIF